LLAAERWGRGWKPCWQNIRLKFPLELQAEIPAAFPGRADQAGRP